MERVHVTDAATIGRIVRDGRRAQGLRQEELALAAGTGRRFISDLENGKRTVRLGDVLSVLRALGVRIEAVTGGTARDGRA